MVRQIFVYGTLKRGQRNEAVWPAPATTVQISWSHGCLFGRDEYPAMQHGTDHVLGECWQFDEAHISEVLLVLDRLEGTNNNSPHDLYHRSEIEVFDCDDKTLGTAYVYFLVRDPISTGFLPIAENCNGYASWPES